MSRIPEDIPGLGKASELLRQNPDFDPNVYEFDRDSYFLWSRLDGHTTTRDVIVMVGFDPERTIEVLGSLRNAGAILRPGESPPDVAHLIAAARRARAAQIVKAAEEARPQTASQTADKTQPRAADEARPRGKGRARTAQPVDDDLGKLSDEEETAMAADTELDDPVKLRIISMRRKLYRADYFELLGVTQDTDKRALKRAYFRLSKEFHPDRYYRKQTGPFGPWLAQIFETVSKAFEVLSDPTARKRYIASVTGEQPVVALGQSREEYARELFDRACTTETGGDIERALKLFAAALRVDAGKARYFGRAARCATAAGDLAVAEEYAKKAAALEPHSPSVARILADVYRAAGKLDLAESTLVHALSLKSENDVLAKELARELAAVRAAKAS